MSITDELREWAKTLTHWWYDPVKDEYIYTTGTMLPSIDAVGLDSNIIAIADRIDAEHQKALDEWKAEHGQMWLKGYSECHAELLEGNETLASDLERCGWIRMPKDADGEPFHIGELVDEMLPFGGYAAPAPIDTMELSRGASGYVWMVKLDAENRALISPKLLRHHAPTVEDVLTEFGIDWEHESDCEDRAALLKEYASKLRLVEGED